MPLHQRTIVAGSLVNLDEDNGPKERQGMRVLEPDTREWLTD